MRCLDEDAASGRLARSSHSQSPPLPPERGVFFLLLDSERRTSITLATAATAATAGATAAAAAAATMTQRMGVGRRGSTCELEKLAAAFRKRQRRRRSCARCLNAYANARARARSLCQVTRQIGDGGGDDDGGDRVAPFADKLRAILCIVGDKERRSAKGRQPTKQVDGA